MIYPKPGPANRALVALTFVAKVACVTVACLIGVGFLAFLRVAFFP